MLLWIPLLALAALLVGAPPAPALAAAAARLDPAVWSRVNCSQPDLRTPTYADKSAVFFVCSSAVLDAPLERVYRATVDFDAYPRWNSFVRSVDVPKGLQTPGGVYVGMPMTFHSAGLAPFGLDTPSNELVSVLQPPPPPPPSAAAADGHDDAPRRFAASAWKFSANDALLAAEHPNLLTELPNGSTSYVSYEAYYSPLSYATAALLKGALKAQFDAQTSDLKRFVEGA